MGFFSRNKKKYIELTPADFKRASEDANCNCASAEPLSFQALLTQAYSYRTLSAVYACIELISNAVASMPLRVVKEDEHGHREVVKHHPLQRIFRDKNIQTLSMYNIIKQAVTDMLVSGNGYIQIKRGESGVITSLRWIKASAVSVQYDDNRDTLYYIITLDSLSKKVKPEEIIHITKNSLNGVVGVPLGHFAKDVFDLTKTTEKAAQDFFNSGMNVNGVLSAKVNLNQKAMDEITAKWRASAKSDKLRFLPLGVDYQQVGVDAKSSQMLESRTYNTQEVARFFGVPVQLIQSGEKLTYNNLEQLNLLFFQHTLMPYIRVIESEFTRKLFFDDDELIVDMDEDEFLLRTDKASTASYLSTLVGGGIMTVNEARKELGLSEVEAGDELHLAFSDASKAKIGSEENIPNEKNEQDIS